MKNLLKYFKKSELALILLVCALIGVSEYYFVIMDQPLKAIFVGLWCPTILLFVIIFNLKMGNRNGKS